MQSELGDQLTKYGHIRSLDWAEQVFGDQLKGLTPEEKEIFIANLSPYDEHVKKYVEAKPNYGTMNFVNWKHGVYTNYSNNKNDGRGSNNCLIF